MEGPMNTEVIKPSLYEKSFIPIFIVGSFIVGIFAFGALIPVAFVIVPIIAVPALFLGYSYLLKNKGISFSTQVENIEKRRGVVMYTHEEKRKMVDESQRESAKMQIQQIESKELPDLTEQMPADGSAVQHFAPLGAHQWIYRFHFKSQSAEFNAIGLGLDPNEAFSAAKKVVLKQIEEWHCARDKDVPYVGVDQADLLRRLTNVMNFRSDDQKVENKRNPTVLIIEDDPDVAAATEAVFKKLGCKTMVSNGHDGASHTMSFQHVDFIVLDWILGNNLFADQLVKGSNRIIESFKDLRSHFRRQHAKVITYSALDEAQARLPESKYFEQIDHWQKPTKYPEMVDRASKLLMSYGF
jgi:CheY-like chemotaxis protein